MPSNTRNDSASNIDRLLMGLTGLRGVTAAAVVDSDGLCTHIRRDFEIDTDALGASVQVALGSARRSSENVGQTHTSLVVIENKDGLVLLAPLTQGFALALMADGSAMLGSVRFEMRRTLTDLNAALS